MRLEFAVDLPPIWFQKYVGAPWKEGLERIQRAWHGRELPPVPDKKLSWGDRTISAIQGGLLITPLIGSIIWFVKEFFKDRQSPETPTREPTAPSSNITDLTGPTPTPEVLDVTPESSQPIETKTLTYALTLNNEARSATRTISAFEAPTEGPLKTGVFDVKKTSTSGEPLSRGIYDSRWNLIYFEENDFIMTREIKGHGVDTLYDIVLKKGIEGEPKHHEIKETTLWIQDPMVGFQQFAKSTQKTTTCFCLFTEFAPLSIKFLKKADETDRFSMEGTASKGPIEPVDEFGPLQKISISIRITLARLTLADVWVDPKTGEGKKAISYAQLNFPASSEIVRPPNPPLVPEHP